jgi:hypothetical protein
MENYKIKHETIKLFIKNIREKIDLLSEHKLRMDTSNSQEEFINEEEYHLLLDDDDEEEKK